MRIRGTMLSLGLSGWIMACGDDSGFKSGVNQNDPSKIPPVSANDNGGAGAKPKNDLDAGGFGKLGAVSDTQSVSLKVDLVFAIDTSGSMNEELAATQANLGRLISTLNSGRLDSRIHMMLEAPFALPAGSDSTKIAFAVQRIASNDAITHLNNLFAGTYATFYQNDQRQPLPAPIAFRKEAKLEVVVVSDDNGAGTGNLAADFDPTKSLKATFNAIIGLPTSVAGSACNIAAVGSEYITLSSQSGGSVLDLCSTDWSALIGRLSNDIVKRSVTFPLSKKPNIASIQVGLDGKKIPASDYAYDPVKNTITLIKTDAVKDGSKLLINYNSPG